MTHRSTIAAIAAATLALPAAAGAHVTVSPTEAAADGYAMLELGVPHGCEDSATTSLTVQMPDQVVSATPQEVAGWTISMKEGKLATPVESHGETITEGVREVTWSGGPLDPHHLQVFGLSVRFAGEPGDTAAFKAIQTCEEGETAWIELAAEGQAEPQHPAPTVALTAAAEHAPAADTADGAAAAGSGDDGGGASTGLVVAALVVGALGLVSGVAALATGRRRTA